MNPLPTALAPNSTSLVELPCNWYMEDMTPMQFWPNTSNSHGYVAPGIIEQMWKDRFEYLYNDCDFDAGESGDVIFPIILHPDTSGMAHVIGMIDRVIGWLKGKGEEVEFVTYGKCAMEWKSKQKL